MEKKYTNIELKDAVDRFWDHYHELRREGVTEYASTSIAFDEFKEKLGWGYHEYEVPKD